MTKKEKGAMSLSPSKKEKYAKKEDEASAKRKEKVTLM